MSTNYIDPTALDDWSRPLDRARVELYCLARTIMPDDETFERTVATIILMFVWASIVLGPMFTGADPARYEIVIGTTAIVFLVLGKMWDIEENRLLDAIPLADGESRDKQRDD